MDGVSMWMPGVDVYEGASAPGTKAGPEGLPRPRDQVHAQVSHTRATVSIGPQ